MADEPENLVLRLLQEIRADLAATKTEHDQRFDQIDRDLAAIKETQRLHGLRLDNHTEIFSDLGEKMRAIVGLLRDQAIAAELRALAARIDALENRRQ